MSDDPVLPSYVQRTADHDLRTAIQNAGSTSSSRERLIVVAGESKAGKTRTLLEALNECCPDSRLIWLRPPDQAEEVPPLSVLADAWDAALNDGAPPGVSLVVVLDDLQYHCSVRTNAISHSALSAVAQHASLIIVATCQPSFLRLDPSDRGREVPRADPEVVRWANERAISLDGQLDHEERTRAIDTFAGAIREQRVTTDSLGRLAETLASVDQLTAKYRSASADPQHAHRAALVDAATDHWVLMPGFAVSIDLLVEFAQRHFKDRFPTRGWRSHHTDDAVEWATEPLGHVHALLRDVASEGAPVLRLHDGVAAKLASSWDPAAWIPEFREKLPPMALFNVGLFLEGQGRRAQAEVWYQLLSEAEGTSTSARRLIAAYLM